MFLFSHWSFQNLNVEEVDKQPEKHDSTIDHNVCLCRGLVYHNYH